MEVTMDSERIRKEIAKFEGKYGASAVAFEGAEKATEVVDAAPPPDPLLDGALQDFNRRKGTLQLTDEPAGGAAASGALAGSGTAGVTAGASPPPSSVGPDPAGGASGAGGITGGLLTLCPREVFESMNLRNKLWTENPLLWMSADYASVLVQKYGKLVPI